MICVGCSKDDSEVKFYKGNNKRCGNCIYLQKIARVAAKEVILPTNIVCNTCNIPKPVSNYAKSKQILSGHSSKCKDCTKSSLTEEVKQQTKDYRKKYAKDNPAIMKAAQTKYLSKTSVKEHYKIKKKEYRKNNRHIFAANHAKRKAKMLKATPKWANEEKIKDFYTTSQGLSMLLGEFYHVDHIVPLVSDLVCGLHCEANLRVILGSENMSKGNKYWQDMPT